MQAKRRVQSVEIWRLVFAVTIILCHACFLIPWNYGGSARFRQSTLGVEFFYILAGFLFAQGIDKLPEPAEKLGKETWNYVFQRMKKIYPEFLFAAILNFGILLIVCNQNPFAKDDWYLYLWDFAFLNCTGLAGAHESAVGGCWYLSGMFLSMAILYPLIRKNKDTFLHIIAPLAAAFLMGWFAFTKGTIGQALDFENGICLGLLRAIAEMCVGCVCYTVSQKAAKSVDPPRYTRSDVRLMSYAPFSGRWQRLFLW